MTAETIQRGKLFKGGNDLKTIGGFDRGNYSKEETIQGRKLLIIRRFRTRKLFKGGWKR